MPLNLSFVGLKGRLTGILLKEYITPWVEAHQNNKWPNFTVRRSEVVSGFYRAKLVFETMVYFAYHCCCFYLFNVHCLSIGLITNIIG